MSISIPHSTGNARSEDEAVRQALELLQRTPPTVVERVLTHDAGPAAGYLHSLTRVLGFTHAVETLSSSLAALETTVPPGVARAAQATENVWRSIDAEFGLLSSSDVARLLGATGANRAYASGLRSRGEIAGIERKNAFRYPGFQFDAPHERVHSWVAPLLKLAATHERSASDALVWMVAPSTFFDGARPVDHAADGDRILTGAARAWGTEW